MSSNEPQDDPPDDESAASTASEATLDAWARSVSTTIDNLTTAIENVTTAFDQLAQRVAFLEARAESDSLWNVGLVKLVLVQEFKSWQHWGMTQQQADESMTDWKRDKASAEMAFDHFVKSMPPQIRDEIAGQRRSLVEMLMEYAGHDPMKGN